MLDTTPPEIDVERLMRQIREDAERDRQGLPVNRTAALTMARRSAAFHLPRLPEAPAALPRQDRYTLSELLDRQSGAAEPAAGR